MYMHRRLSSSGADDKARKRPYLLSQLKIGNVIIGAVTGTVDVEPLRCLP